MSDDRQALLEEFQRRLGYSFRRPELLERALTHRSYANERGLDENYERLEFLGDAVLVVLVQPTSAGWTRTTSASSSWATRKE